MFEQCMHIWYMAEYLYNSDDGVCLAVFAFFRNINLFFYFWLSYRLPQWVSSYRPISMYSSSSSAQYIRRWAAVKWRIDKKTLVYFFFLSGRTILYHSWLVYKATAAVKVIKMRNIQPTFFLCPSVYIFFFLLPLFFADPLVSVLFFFSWVVYLFRSVLGGYGSSGNDRLFKTPL